jgi:hypothetical protein
VTVPATTGSDPRGIDSVEAMARQGRAAKDIARALIEAAGFSGIQEDVRQPGGVDVHLIGRDHGGGPWYFEVAGGFTTHRSGLGRPDVLMKALGKAAVLQEIGEGPVVVLTTGRPRPGTPAAETLKRMTGPDKPIYAVVDMLTRDGLDQLQEFYAGRSAGGSGGREANTSE